jgi:hypothetical protein
MFSEAIGRLQGQQDPTDIVIAPKRNGRKLPRGCQGLLEKAKKIQHLSTCYVKLVKASSRPLEHWP